MIHEIFTEFVTNLNTLSRVKKREEGRVTPVTFSDVLFYLSWNLRNKESLWWTVTGPTLRLYSVQTKNRLWTGYNLVFCSVDSFCSFLDFYKFVKLLILCVTSVIYPIIYHVFSFSYRIIVVILYTASTFCLLLGMMSVKSHSYPFIYLLYSIWSSFF